MVYLSEMADPRAVWKAIEGDRAELIALLRSEKQLTRRTRDTLADWLDGKLGPVKLAKGRPPKKDEIRQTLGGYYGGTDRRGRRVDSYCFFSHAHSYGFDTGTEIGRAGWRYQVRRAFIRQKGWHLKKAGRFYWSSERLMAAIAERHGINLEMFANYLKRAKQKLVARQWSPFKSIARKRWEIAGEIRRAKVREKG